MDDQQALYAPDTTIRLIEQFKTAFGDYFKTYFEATPTTPPSDADYPVLIVQKLRNQAVVGPTSTDNLTERIAITVAINQADDVGSANIRTTTMRKLEHLVEGLDPSTNQYKTDTVLYVIRTHLTLLQSTGQIWLLDSNAEITYNQRRSADQPTICIADIVMTTQRRVIVSGRT